jgi:hypothetical protein
LTGLVLCIILILLEIFRSGAAKELSAASFQHYLYHRGCVGQRDPVNTRGIKAARGRRGIIIPVGYIINCREADFDFWSVRL